MHMVSPYMASGRDDRGSRPDQTRNIGLTQEGDDEEDEEPIEVCAISSSANRASCLWVMVEFPPGSSRGASTRASLDTGNLTRQGIVVSEEFFYRAGLRYASRLTGSVGTASLTEMKQLGVTKVFALQLVGNNYRFLTKAVVLRGLQAEVNLGSGFLQRIGA